MRYLHPVAAHEQFIASGVYTHTEHDRPTRFTEAWTMHEVGEGGRLTRLDRDARFTEGWSQLAEVLQAPDGQVERYTYEITQHKPNAPYKTLKTDYIFAPDVVQITRRVDHAEAEISEIALPTPQIVVRLLDYHLFWGAAAVRSAPPVAAPLTIFVPLQKVGFPAGKLVTGSLLTVTQVNVAPIKLGKKTYPAQCYQTKGERWVWVDEQQIPLRIVGLRDQTVDALTEYAHR
jgi:hypothetical protein